MMKIIERSKTISIPNWSVPAFLFLIALTSFGLLLPGLGFYWDDWAKSLVHRLYGVEGYLAYYAYDRPLSAWTHILLFPVLGETPIHWHIFTLLMRWLSAVAMWWSLCLLWPNARRQVTFAACLFLVYPSFTQQSIAMTFHQQWMQYALFFLSIGSMILALRCRKFFWLLTTASVIACGMQITITEYFIPLELLRPLMLWFILGENHMSTKERVMKTLQHWAPYFLVVITYIIWRQFFMQLVEEDPYRMKLLSDLVIQPISTIKRLTKVIILDIYFLSIGSWASVISMGLPVEVPKMIWKGGVVAILVALACSQYFRMLRYNDEIPGQNNHRGWMPQMMTIGFFAMILGILPAWLIGRSSIDDFHANRYTLPAMWGICLIFVCLIDSAMKKGYFQNITLGIMIGLSAAFHLQTADQYRELWDDQVNFYWQLHWRAPYLQPGTALLLEDEPFPDQGLFSTSSVINFLYPQPEKPDHLAYYVYTLRLRYNVVTPDLSEINFNSSFRSLSFSGSTPHTLLVYYDTEITDCLWVLDPERDRDEPYLSELMKKVLPVSNLDQIKNGPIEANYPPEEVIGPEPVGTWCSYYQAAELARQNKNWPRVSELAEEAIRKGFDPYLSESIIPHEWLVFIEGYAHTGAWDKAQELTEKLSQVSYGQSNASLCSLWKDIGRDKIPSQERETASGEINTELKCDSL